MVAENAPGKLWSGCQEGSTDETDHPLTRTLTQDLLFAKLEWVSVAHNKNGTPAMQRQCANEESTS